MTDKIIPDPPATLEDNLLRVSDLLRCAAATAYESGDNLSGVKRDMAFSCVYLIDIARAELGRALLQLESG